MIAATTTPYAALKYEVEVREQGRIEFTVPFKPGARLVIFVIEEVLETFDDLVSAAQSTLDFWDNPFDDEDWNDFGRVNATTLERIRAFLQQLTT